MSCLFFFPQVLECLYVHEYILSMIFIIMITLSIILLLQLACVHEVIPVWGDTEYKISLYISDSMHFCQEVLVPVLLL